MRIAVIQASSQAEKHAMLLAYTRQYAPGHEVISLGCTPDEEQRYSYIEIALLAGLLLASHAVELVITGCSSGQGMMLACNSMPGMLCGYAPSPRDAWLFAQINDGNALSLPLGEEYTYQGEDNLRATLEALFSEPFGRGYPRSEAERKKRDTLLLKRLRSLSQKSFTDFARQLEPELWSRVLRKRDAVELFLEHGRDEALREFVLDRLSQMDR